MRKLNLGEVESRNLEDKLFGLIWRWNFTKPDSLLFGSSLVFHVLRALGVELLPDLEVQVIVLSGDALKSVEVKGSLYT